LEKEHEQYMKTLLENLKRIDYIKPEELPNIDLYMDQVTTFMDKHLESSKRYSEDKLLTKTMINNYTKNNLLPSPNKKKYSKDHMYLLIFIYYMKNILSITDIQSILNPLTEKFFGEESETELEDIYKEIFSLGTEQSTVIAKDVIRKYERSKDSFTDVADSENEQFLQMFSFISMLCFDVYMKKQLIEKLIDDHFPKADPKEKDKDKHRKNEK